MNGLGRNAIIEELILRVRAFGKSKKYAYMIHFLSIHTTRRWIDIQRRFIERNVAAPHRYWLFLEDEGFEFSETHAPPNYYIKQSGVVDPPNSGASGCHIRRLNKLTCHVLSEWSLVDEDVLVFLDSDAFLIRDIEPLIEKLKQYPIIAVQRLENGDRHSHPCFFMTTVRTWKSLNGGCGTKGPMWSQGRTHSVLRPRKSDTGGAIYNEIIRRGLNWLPLNRTNVVDFAPVLFGIYGNTVYHHGCGSRSPVVDVHSVAVRGKPQAVHHMRCCFGRMSNLVYQRIENEPNFFKVFEGDR